MSNNVKSQKMHEPFIRIANRDSISFAQKVGIRIASVILALIIDAVFILLVTGLKEGSVFEGKLVVHSDGVKGDYLVSATLSGNKINLTRSYNLEELMLCAKPNDVLICIISR